MTYTKAEFETIYKIQRAPLAFYLQAHGATREEARDAVSAAFLCLLKARSEIRNVSGWLRFVALKEHRRMTPRERTSRRSMREVSMPPSDVEADSGTPSQSSFSDDLAGAEVVLAALALLPTTQRHVLALHLDGYANSDIASMLGLTTIAVRQNLSRAKRTLRQRLTPSKESST